MNVGKVKGQTFVFGAIILLISNVLVKIIGAFFRLPITNIIGVEGMAYFNSAYAIYVVFYNISTAGIPVAVARMVAASNERQNHEESHKIFKIALRMFLIIGFVGTAVMMSFSKVFANSAKMPVAYLAMIAIAPTIFFICVSSAYRGYFQGLSDMVPTGVSQVIESVGKLGIGLAAAIICTGIGMNNESTAAFVISGVSIGVALSTVYVIALKYKRRNVLLTKNTELLPVRNTSDILKELIVTAIPITLASSIMGLTNIVDTFVLPRQLLTTGITESAATSFYGTYSSMVIPLFNMTPTFIYPFAISAIPAVSAAIAVGDKDKAFKNIESAFRNCSLIAIPCAIGMGTMSARILDMLFSKHETIETGIDTVTTHGIASPALSVVSASIFFLGIIAITNSVLQTWRKERLTIISTCSGVVVKLVVTWIVSGLPGSGIMGSAVGTAACYFTIMALNLFFVIKYTGYVPHIGRIFAKPLVAGICCGLSAYGTAYALDMAGLHRHIVTIVAIGVAVVVYAAVVLLSKGIYREDVMMMPKGAKLASLMDKFNLLDKKEMQ